MTTKSNLNKFSRLKIKIQSLNEDIKFLRTCQKEKIVPNFIKVSTAVKNYRTTKVLEMAKKAWLNLEIKHLFNELAETELKAYGLHLKLTKNMNLYEIIEWYEFEEKVFDRVQKVVQQKAEKHEKKLSELLSNKTSNEKVMFTPELVPDFVVNLSNQDFSERELNLLNKGLKYTPKPNNIPLTDAVVDVESIIQYKTYSVQNDIRASTQAIIESIRPNTTKNEEFDTVKNLNQKNCAFLKADKGNKLVVLDNEEYDERMANLILDSSYETISRNPLPKMIRECDVLRKSISKVFGCRLERNLIVSNPTVAKLYGLPKIHKIGNKMRPIVSNVNTPCYKIAKWLVNDLKKLPAINSLSVKNSYEFAEKISDVKIKDDEIMVSFDVTSLFPSVPVEEALDSLKEHLILSDVPIEKRMLYQKVAKTCMEHSFFQFRDVFYKVNKGTNMGNPLSPLIAELFMATFELNLKEQNLLPRIWFRYVDDIFAIVKSEDVENILSVLDSQCESIKFTYEKEIENSLPFLDLLLTRNGSKIEFAVYHKPTSTNRTITSDSHCPIQHKRAAYHSMVHRLCKLPLSVNAFRNEYLHIKKVARTNGFNDSMIDDLIKKHSRKIKHSECSTFFTLPKEEEMKRVSMSYVPQITNKIGHKFRDHNMQIVYRNNNKIANLLGSVKDKTEPLKKSGIYCISCGDCDKKYYGQTKRSIEKRFKEHSAYINKRQCTRSALAEHVWSEGHFNVSLANVKLIKQVNDNRLLNAYESYYIKNDEHSMNKDNGNIDSALFNCRI